MSRWRLACASVAAASIVLSATIALGALWPAPMPRGEAWGTRVLDRHGALIAMAPAPGGVWRFETAPSQVSPFLVELLVAVEDRRFAATPGVDPAAMLRAAWQWARAGRVVSGGSTLTMQVAKLLDPRPRSLGAKAIEAARGLDLWRRLPRARILGLWLSLAPYGGNLVGVEAASRAYFGEPPGALDAAEAALLVALPRRPEALRPDRHPDAARRARDRVLLLAEARGLLTPGETAAALAEPVPGARRSMPCAAPQVFARSPARPDLATTLDAASQAALERLARATLGEQAPQVSLAIMVADLPSRFVRAVWAGDVGLDLTRAVRSPGSALKPFLYGLAFGEGLANPDTVLADSPARFGDYAPEDFSGRFIGRVTAADALRRSLNLPAVALLARYGPQRFAATLAASGQALRLPSGSPASLATVLGGAGATMRGLMALYAALATDGAVTPLRWQPGGAATGARLLTPAAAQAVAAILTRKLPGVPAERGIAWKTGTSWGGRDSWAFGFDRNHLVGVWIGRPDGSAMTGAAADRAVPVLARVFGLLAPAPRLAHGPEHLVSLAAVPQADPLRLLFPPPDAVIAGDGPIGLTAMGGVRPLRFLVDGAPVPSVGALREAPWTPPSPGFYRVTVLDARGSAAAAAIRVTAP